MGRCTFSGSKEIKCDDKSPLDPQITKWKCKHKAQTKTTSCKTLSKWPCFGFHLFARFTIEAASGQWGALTYYFLIRARVGSHLDGDWVRFIWESSHSLLRKPLTMALSESRSLAFLHLAGSSRWEQLDVDLDPNGFLSVKVFVPIERPNPAHASLG